MIRLENQASNYTWNRCNLHADLDKSGRNEERKGGYIGAWKIVQPCDSDGKKFYDRFLLFICLINSIKRKKKRGKRSSIISSWSTVSLVFRFRFDESFYTIQIATMASQ